MWQEDTRVLPVEQAEGHDARAAVGAELGASLTHLVPSLAGPDGDDERRGAKTSRCIGWREHRNALDLCAPQPWVGVRECDRRNPEAREPMERPPPQVPCTEQDKRSPGRGSLVEGRLLTRGGGGNTLGEEPLELCDRSVFNHGSPLPQDTRSFALPACTASVHDEIGAGHVRGSVRTQKQDCPHVTRPHAPCAPWE